MNDFEWLSGRYLLTFGYVTEGLYALQVWDTEAALDDSSSRSSSGDFLANEEDTHNVKLVGEWLGRGKLVAASLTICDTVTPDRSVLIGFCNSYQDRCVI